MKRYLAFLFALLALPALADDLVATNGRDSVRLTQGACHAEVLPLLAIAFPQVADRFRAATAQVEGSGYTACWLMRPDGKVLLIYPDGDTGLIPWSDFKRAPST